MQPAPKPLMSRQHPGGPSADGVPFPHAAREAILRFERMASDRSPGS